LVTNAVKVNKIVSIHISNSNQQEADIDGKREIKNPRRQRVEMVRAWWACGGIKWIVD